MAKKSRRAASRGLTFVELLLVMFVFIAAGTGILGSYLSTHFLSQYAKDTMISTGDLKDMMERINATPFATLLANFPNDAANANGYQTIVAGQTGGTPNPFALQNESITVTYPSQTATRLEVLVTVNWRSLGRDRSASMSTIRTSS